MGVRRNYCIKLHYPEAFFLSHSEAVQHQFFPNMFTPDISSYCITGITYMTTSANIIRMKNVKSNHFSVILINCKPCISLLFEKSISTFFCQIFFLRKCHPVIHYLIPDFTCSLSIFCCVFSDFYVHFFCLLYQISAFFVGFKILNFSVHYKIKRAEPAIVQLLF